MDQTRADRGYQARADSAKGYQARADSARASIRRLAARVPAALKMSSQVSLVVEEVVSQEDSLVDLVAGSTLVQPRVLT